MGPVAATLTTALTGTNNDLLYTARDAGPGGNDITITYAVAGNNTPLTVGVNGKQIVVNVATDGGGAATSTGSAILAAVAANINANTLVSVELAPSNDGTGVVTSLTATALAGGTLGVAQPSQTNSDATNDMVVTPRCATCSSSEPPACRGSGWPNGSAVRAPGCAGGVLHVAAWADAGGSMTADRR